MLRSAKCRYVPFCILVNLPLIDFQRGIAEAIAQRGSQELASEGSGGDPLLNLKDRVTEAESLSSNLDDRLDMTEDHVFTLQQHVNKLQDHADSLAPVIRDDAADTLAEVKAGVASLNELIARQYNKTPPVAVLTSRPTEMRSLHQDMEKQMASKLASVEAARVALTVATSEAQVRSYSNLNRTPYLNTTQAVSLKRKRSDMEAEDASFTGFDPAAVMGNPIPTYYDIDTREKKRPRQIVSSVMHTATAVAIGAVATWSALAFS